MNITWTQSNKIQKGSDKYTDKLFRNETDWHKFDISAENPMPRLSGRNYTDKRSKLFFGGLFF